MVDFSETQVFTDEFKNKYDVSKLEVDKSRDNKAEYIDIELIGSRELEE